MAAYESMESEGDVGFDDQRFMSDEYRPAISSNIALSKLEEYRHSMLLKHHSMNKK